jgi:hypothetical protein
MQFERVVEGNSNRKGVTDMEKIQIEVTCTYDADTKRTHRYLIDLGQVITGAIYIQKGTTPPDSVILRLKTKGDRL